MLFISVTAWSQQPKDTFCWGKEEISWEDYKGIPKTNGGSDAVTASLIHMSVEYPSNLKPQITIETLFNRSASWVKNRTHSLLIHEQGHFDITEIYARKLRREVLSRSFNSKTFEDEIFQLHKKFCMQMDAYQDRYDAETNYSRNSEMQLKWNESIKNSMQELKSLADPKLSLILNE